MFAKMFAKLMKESRLRQNISIYQLERLTGISSPMLYKYEQAVSQPTLSKADAILKVLGETLTLGKQ